MLKEKIISVRNKLNKMIEDGEKEELVYKASQELDTLIAEYYAKKIENN